MAFEPEAQPWVREKRGGRINPFTRKTLTPSQQNEAASDLAQDQNIDRSRQNWINQVAAQQNAPSGNGIQVEDRTKPQQAQLSAEEEGRATADMQVFKQRQLAQIAKQEASLERELSELEGNLKNFRNGKTLRTVFLSGSPITFLIDRMVEEAKKPLRNLDDRAKAKKLQTLITMISALLIKLQGLRLLTALLDAFIFHRFSLVRMIVLFLPTIILPIILILTFPLYILFLSMLILLGKVPLFKGPLTQQVIELIEKLKKQQTSWKKQLETINKKISIRNQLKKIQKAKQQIQVSQ